MPSTDAADLVTLIRVLERPDWAGIALTARGGGTGTNGQSLNRGVIVDLRRHMHRLLALNTTEGWADVEPGMVLDDLNARIRPSGWFVAPETSTSTRCTIGGMVSTDASGKGSRVYGKTSDNILGLELACAQGLLDSMAPAPDWARPMLIAAEAASRAGRAAFVARTPRLNRRFTGYDLERACPEQGGFDWWRLFPGAEGTLGPISRIRVRLRRIEAEKRLIIAGFHSFREALAAAAPLLAAQPTAVEVMDETVQAIAEDAGILDGLPAAVRAAPGKRLAYLFIEINGDDPAQVAARLMDCRAILAGLPGTGGLHVAADLAEIRALWAIRSAGVGLLGRVDGPGPAGEFCRGYGGAAPDRQMRQAPPCDRFPAERHAQDAQYQGLARAPPTSACPLHAHIGIVDQPGRALVRGTDPQAAAARRPSLDCRTRG